MTAPQNHDEAERALEGGLLQTLRRLYGHLGQKRRIQLSLLLVLMLVGALAELMSLGAVLPFLALMADPARAADMPVLGRLFAALGWQNGDFLIPATFLFVIVTVLASAMRLLLAWSNQRFGFRLGHDLSVEVYQHTLYQPYAWHTARNSSASIAGLNKVQAVIGYTILPLMQAITAVIISMFIFAALLAINAVVALISALGFGALYCVILLVSRKRLRANSAIIAQAQTQWFKAIQEGLGGIRDVIINRTQIVYLKTYAQVDFGLRDAQAMNSFISAAPRFVIEGTGMAMIALLALALSRGPGGLAEALPVLGALALGAIRLLPLLQSIYVGWAQIAGNRHNLLDVLDVLDLPLPSQLPQQQKVPALPFTRAITLQKISFGYQAGRAAVLTDVDLVIPKGSRIGIIGKTGSGKSTLVDLIMGLLAPTSGTLCIDDTPLSAANIAGWQTHIAHVPQAIYLSDASMAENIAFGVPQAQIDHDRLHSAAQRAEIADFIDALPAGYETFVGERGVRLSGGQRQRLGIARALYRDADVLVFDEATSALDTETEAAVMEAVNSLGHDLTILIIAHRLATLEGCDAVIRLENGRVQSQQTIDAIASSSPSAPSVPADPHHDVLPRHQLLRS